MGPIEIQTQSPLTVICGANGVGKSTLLAALLACLDGSQVSDHARAQLRGGFAYASMVTDTDGYHTRLAWLSDESSNAAVAQESAIPVFDTADTQEPTIAMFDAASDTQRVRDFFRGQPNIDDLITEAGLHALSDAERNTIAYVVARDYNVIEQVEITDVGVKLSGADAIPYFRVTSGSASYGSETMGLGELALHLLVWYVRRLPAKSVLLLEEPESFISPISQVHLANFLVEQIDRRKISIVLTTHSPAIVARSPRSSVVLAVRHNGQTIVRQAPTDVQLADAIGLKKVWAGVALVEDRNAADMLQVLLNKFAPSIAASVLISPVGAEGIGGSIAHAVSRQDSFKHIGVYDGDQRVRRANVESTTFLPTQMAPEAFLRAAANDNPLALALALGFAREDVQIILGNLEGRDLHDWYEELRKQIRWPHMQLMQALLELWLQNPDNEAQARTCVASVCSLLEP